MKKRISILIMILVAMIIAFVTADLQAQARNVSSINLTHGNAGPMLIPYEPDDDMVVTVLVVNQLKVVPLAKDTEKNGYETGLGSVFKWKFDDDNPHSLRCSIQSEGLYFGLIRFDPDENAWEGRTTE